MSERTRLEGIRERDARRENFFQRKVADEKEEDIRWLLEQVDTAETIIKNFMEEHYYRRNKNQDCPDCGHAHLWLTALYAKETPRG